MNIGELTGREFDIIISALEEYGYSLQESKAAREVTKLQIKLLRDVGEQNELKPHN